VRTRTLERLYESETFCSVDFECEDCSVLMTASSIHLPETIKEKSLLSRESQQRQPPLPMRLPPDFKALRHRSLPHPDLRC
jgi:hypothetical protein